MDGQSFRMHPNISYTRTNCTVPNFTQHQLPTQQRFSIPVNELFSNTAHTNFPYPNPTLSQPNLRNMYSERNSFSLNTGCQQRNRQQFERTNYIAYCAPSSTTTISYENTNSMLEVENAQQSKPVYSTMERSSTSAIQRPLLYSKSLMKRLSGNYTELPSTQSNKMVHPANSSHNCVRPSVNNLVHNQYTNMLDNSFDKHTKQLLHQAPALMRRLQGPPEMTRPNILPPPYAVAVKQDTRNEICSSDIGSPYLESVEELEMMAHNLFSGVDEKSFGSFEELLNINSPLLDQRCIESPQSVGSSSSLNSLNDLQNLCSLVLSSPTSLNWKSQNNHSFNNEQYQRIVPEENSTPSSNSLTPVSNVLTPSPNELTPSSNVLFSFDRQCDQTSNDDLRNRMYLNTSSMTCSSSNDAPKPATTTNDALKLASNSVAANHKSERKNFYQSTCSKNFKSNDSHPVQVNAQANETNGKTPRMLKQTRKSPWQHPKVRRQQSYDNDAVCSTNRSVFSLSEPKPNFIRGNELADCVERDKKSGLYFQNKSFYQFRQNLRELAKLKADVKRESVNDLTQKSSKLFFNQLLTKNTDTFVLRSVTPSVTDDKAINLTNMTKRKIIIHDIPQEFIHKYSEDNTQPFHYLGEYSGRKLKPSQKLMKLLASTPTNHSSDAVKTEIHT